MRVQQLLVGDALLLGPPSTGRVDAAARDSIPPWAHDVPLFGVDIFRHMLGDDVVDEIVTHVGDHFGHAVALHQVDAFVEDHLALVVLDIVELQEVLADVEVAHLDLLLRLLQRLVDPGIDDRLALFQASRVGVESAGRSRRSASDRLPATGRISSARGRPDGRNSRATGCRCAAIHGVRSR